MALVSDSLEITLYEVNQWPRRSVIDFRVPLHELKNWLYGFGSDIRILPSVD